MIAMVIVQGFWKVRIFIVIVQVKLAAGSTDSFISVYSTPMSKRI